MRAVGIKTLKNRLSEYIRVAANGETILVTDHDHVVAELGPPQAGRADNVTDAMLGDVIRQGWLRPPLIVCKARPTRTPVATLKALLAELAADRGDR